MKSRLLLTLVLGCVAAGCSKKATESYAPPVLPPAPSHPLKQMAAPNTRDGIKLPKDAPAPPKDFFVPPMPDFSQPPPMPKHIKQPPPPPVPPPPGGPPPLP